MARRKDTKENVVRHEEEYEEIIELTDVVEEYSPSPYIQDKSSENPEWEREDFLTNEKSSEKTYASEIDLDEVSIKSSPDSFQSRKMIGIDSLDAKIVEGIIREVSQEVADKIAKRIAPDIIQAVVKAMDEKMESIVHELFPNIAEKMITEEIRKLKEGED